jgi:hypothetical protein
MSVPVQPDNRYNRPNNTCPICGRWERSNPQCKGYLGDKEGVVFCTNSQYAGALPGAIPANTATGPGTPSASAG